MVGSLDVSAFSSQAMMRFPQRAVLAFATDDAASSTERQAFNATKRSNHA
jgi:hypothetical protein